MTHILVKPLEIVRVISGYSGMSDRYYNLSDIEWEERNELLKDWRERGFFVQTIFIDDLMIPRVELEISKRDKEQQKD